MQRPRPLVRINRLYATGLDLITKEINHLVELGKFTKLNPGDSRDLINYMKLLRELKMATEADVAERRERLANSKKNLTDGQLEEQVLRVLKE